MKNTLLFILTILPSIIIAQNYNEVSWIDLHPAIEFDDPFEKLSYDQLYNLRQVADYRAGIKTHNSKVVSQQQIDSLENKLKSENININKLLAQREEITNKRRLKAESINNELDGKNIRISGYLLPLNFVGDKTTEFLLVPVVGDCIHAPAPPKNQLIFVSTSKGIVVEEQFLAVTVEGTINTGDKTSLLFLVDGSDKITSGYAMMNATVKPFKK